MMSSGGVGGVGGVTRTPSGRIRRIPSDLMKRVRCAYPGCELAVIPSNFARHWKFKHTDLPQPPIESLTVVRGDNNAEAGDAIWNSILKAAPPLSNNNTHPTTLASTKTESNAFKNATASLHPSVTLTSTLRVDGKERKRARQRNYICPECQRPLIGSNFGRHWASKHPHLPQPSLVDLEMEALSGGEEDQQQLSPGSAIDPLALHSTTTITPVVPPKMTIKKRKVVCRECEMPMINSNFSRHWASRHPHLDMPLLSELEVIDVEVDASPPAKKSIPAPRYPPVPPSHLPITIPYPEDEQDPLEPGDEEFEDVEEIEDEDDDDNEETLFPAPQSKSSLHSLSSSNHRRFINNNHHSSSSNLEDYDDEEDLEEVTVEPVHYSNGTHSSSSPSLSHLNNSSSSIDKGLSHHSQLGGKRHKKVYCPECSMPMLCNNFRRHFHRRHGEMLHRMPSIHSLKLVPDEEYEMAQINKGVVPPPHIPSHHLNNTPHSKDCTSSYPEVVHPSSLQQQQQHHHLLNNNHNSNNNNSPVRVKRKIVCSECGMAMIGSNFGRHWASKHSHLPQPALQDLVYADSAESGEAETVVCEPLFFGHPDDDDLSEDDGAMIPDYEPPQETEECLLYCDFQQCSFSSPDKTALNHHRIKHGHFKSNGVSSPPKAGGVSFNKVKKVWKKKVVCPECNLQTITSNFSRHWMAKHGHLPTPGLRDLQVITIDDPGFQGSAPPANSAPSASLEAAEEEVVVDPRFVGMNHVYEDDEDDADDYGEEEDYEISEEPVDCVQEEEEEMDEANNRPHAFIQGYDDEDDDDDDDDIVEEEEVEDDIKIPEEEEHDDDDDDDTTTTTPLKYSNNKINCNFDINSLLEDDDDDGDDQDESGEFASVEVN